MNWLNWETITRQELSGLITEIEDLIARAFDVVGEVASLPRQY